MRSGILVQLAGLGLLCFAGAGCSGAPSAETIAEREKAADLEGKGKVSTKDDLKKRLSDLSESGIGGSAFAGLRTSIESLRATDGPLADALLGDLNDLQKADNPGDVKRIAARMAQRL